MTSTDALLEKMQSVGIKVVRGQPQSETAIQMLESLIGFPLPASYKLFLSEYGYAGSAQNPYLGIVDNDPTKQVGESAYYVTLVVREAWKLPPHHLVVYYDSEQRLATSIDLRSRHENECKIELIEYSANGELDISVEDWSFQSAFIRHMNQLIEVWME